jgi:putative flippase GtrA
LFIPILIQQIVKFFIGGGPGVLVYYGFYYSLTDIFNIYFIFSSIIGSVPSILVSFVIKKYWVFENKNNEFIRKQLYHYLLLSIPTLFGNITLLWVLVDYLKFHFLLSQVALTLLFGTVGFIISRKIFFHKPRY